MKIESRKLGGDVNSAPPMPTLFFLRHGQAEHNVAAERDGPSAYSNPKNTDPHLTDKGRSQVEAAGKQLKLRIGNRPVYVYSSPLIRTIETADIVCSHLKDNVVDRILHDGLLEQLHINHCCNWRMNRSQLETKYPYWEGRLLPEIPPSQINNEGDESVQMRINNFITLVKRLHTEQNSVILLVSHHDTLKSYLQKKLENAEFEQEVYEVEGP